MESHAAPAAAAHSMLVQPTPNSSASAQAAAAAHYFATRAAASPTSNLLLTDREHLSHLEHKLSQARQRFQDLKEEKWKGGSKGCGCGCCSHGYVQARDQKATSVGPDSRSVSETSNLPAKKGGRQHLTRSTVQLGGASSSRCPRQQHQHQQQQQRRSLRINGMQRQANSKDVVDIAGHSPPPPPPVFDV